MPISRWLAKCKDALAAPIADELRGLTARTIEDLWLFGLSDPRLGLPCAIANFWHYRDVPFGALHVIESAARTEQLITKATRGPMYDGYAHSVRYDMLRDFLDAWGLVNVELLNLVLADVAMNPAIDVHGQLTGGPGDLWDRLPGMRYMRLAKAAAELHEQGRFPLFRKSPYRDWTRDEVNAFHAEAVELLCKALGWPNPPEVLAKLHLDSAFGQFAPYPTQLIKDIPEARHATPSLMAVVFNCDDSLAKTSAMPRPLLYDATREKYGCNADYYHTHTQDVRESFLSLMVMDEFFRFSFLGKGIDEARGVCACPFRYVCAHDSEQCRAMTWGEKPSAKCLFLDFFETTLGMDPFAFTIGQVR